MRTAVRPSGVERTFGRDELIVTKTDTKGHIRYANDVFLRVSAYEEHEVLGQPHNLIRHPAMPRAVFKLMWDTIQGGEEIFAYVVNLASDGAHYWVFAHITPSYDAAGRLHGYHSNRRVPDRPAVDECRRIYDQMRAEELRVGSGRAALEASTELLSQLLAERGQTYDEFVWSITGDDGGAGR